MGTRADDADHRVSSRGAEDTEKGGCDGQEALGGRDVINVAGAWSLDVVMAGRPEEAGWLGNEGYPDESDDAGKKVAAAKDLAEKEGTRPCGDDGDEEAEDGCFGEREIMHGICVLLVWQPSDSPNMG